MKDLQRARRVFLLAALMPASAGLAWGSAEASAQTEPGVARRTGSPLHPLQVVLTGDSMTATGDSGPSGARSYRRRLHQLLRSAGIAVNFLGSNGDASGIGGESRHDAWGGAWIGPGGSDNNVFDRLPDALPGTVDPDVVIMALGWNSAIKEPLQAADKYENLVARVALLKPRAQLVLATLSPYRGETGTETAKHWDGYRDLNQRARQIAGRSSSDRFHLADLAAADFSAAEYDDDIHWNQAGADRAARIIFDTIVNGVLPRLP